jgi:hypothetical protein
MSCSDDQYVGTSSLPSAKINRSKLTHLSADQQQELLEILDEFAECFAETSGFCPYVEHSIAIDDDFKPKRLREYRIPEVLKPEVQRQIDELMKNGFIRPSNSSMASPIVAVLKGPSGKGGVRLAIDYRFVNLHSCGDAFVMPHLLDSIKRVGTARYISVFDARTVLNNTPLATFDTNTQLSRAHVAGRREFTAFYFVRLGYTIVLQTLTVSGAWLHSPKLLLTKYKILSTTSSCWEGIDS